MTRRDSFTYNVVLSDFPIVIELESFDQTNSMGVISDGIVLRPADGTVIATVPLSLLPVPGNPASRRCEVPSPGAGTAESSARYRPPADLNLSLVVSFATACGPNPKYEVRVIPASGRPLVRVIRRPNLRDFFVLEYR